MDKVSTTPGNVTPISEVSEVWPAGRLSKSSMPQGHWPVECLTRETCANLQVQSAAKEAPKAVDKVRTSPGRSNHIFELSVVPLADNAA